MIDASYLSAQQHAALAALKDGALRAVDVANAIGITHNGCLQMLAALRARGLVTERRPESLRALRTTGRRGRTGMSIGAARWSLTKAGLQVLEATAT